MRRFGYLADPCCAAAWALYALNRFWAATHFGGAFLRGHFNDLLLIPAALPPVLWLQRIGKLRDHDRPPHWSEIGFHLLVWSVLFEVVGPHWMPVTGDPADVGAYLAGGLAAGLWWNRP